MNKEIQIKKLRKKMDQFDYQIIKILKKRFKTSEKISEVKKKLGIPLLQEIRWNELMKDRLRKSREKPKLSRLFMIKLFECIHQESLRFQRQFRKRKEGHDA